jgi:predicted deacylase
MDRGAVLASLGKTGRLVVAHEAWGPCGVGAEIAALAAEDGFGAPGHGLMRVRVKMPKLGLTMTEGTIVEWRKSTGSRIAAGEILFVVETEKVEVEVEAPATGTLVEILGEVKGVYPVGEVIALIETSPEG